MNVNGSAKVWLLQAFDEMSGVKRNIVLYNGQDVSEIKLVLSSSFNREDIVALKDDAGTVIPISLLSHPDLYEARGTVFRTVLKRDVHVPEGEMKRSASVEELAFARPAVRQGNDLEEEEEESEVFPSYDEITVLKDQWERLHGPISYVDFLELFMKSKKQLDIDSRLGDDETSSSSSSSSSSGSGGGGVGDCELSLEENIEEIRYLTGAGNVTLEQLLSLLPITTKGRKFDDPFPKTISREEFIEMFAVLRSLVPGGAAEMQILEAESDAFTNNLFDVVVHERPGSEEQYVENKINSASLASALTLFCGGEPKDNLQKIYILFEEQYGHQTKIGAGIPDLCVYHHLCSLFRVVWQLCGSTTRSRSQLSAEKLAHKMAVRTLAACPRRYEQGVLSFSEFYACSVTGFENGLKLFYGQVDEDSLSAPHSIERFSPMGKKSPHRETETAFLSNRDYMPTSEVDTIEASEADDSYGNGDQSDEDGMDSPNLEDSLVAASLVDYEGGPLSVPKASKLLGLLRFSPHEVFDALARAADEDAALSYASYQNLMAKLVGRHYSSLDVLKRAVVDHIIAMIFGVFDTMGTHQVRAVDIACALLLFTGGDAEIKARVAAYQLDFFLDSVDDDRQARTVSVQEMTSSLSSLLRVVRGLDPTFLNPLSPNDVAMEITMHAFEAAGLASEQSIRNGDVLDKFLDEYSFCHWFTIVLDQLEQENGTESIDDSIDSQSRSTFDPREYGYDPFSSQNSDGSEDWVMPLKKFWSGSDQESSPARSHGSSAEDSEQRLFVRRRPPPLSIDTDFTEEDGDGPELEEEQEVSPPIESHMQQRSHSMTIDEYQRMYGVNIDYEASEFSSRASVDTDHSETNERGNSEPAPNAPTLELRQARRLLGLDGYPAEDLMETLGERAMAGFVSYKTWLETVHLMSTLAGNGGGSVDSMGLCRKLFDVFRPTIKYGEACVPYIPFLVGLTSLCSSPPEEKVTVAFALLDSNSEGWISSHDFFTFVHSYLLVAYACSSLTEAKVDTYGMPLEDMARSVVFEAERIFATNRFSLEMVAEIAGDSIELSQTTEF